MTWTLVVLETPHSKPEVRIAESLLGPALYFPFRVVLDLPGLKVYENRFNSADYVKYQIWVRRR